MKGSKVTFWKAAAIAAIIQLVALVFAADSIDELFSSRGGDAPLIRYGGQVYPEEMLLAGAPWLWGDDVAIEHTLFSSGTEGNQALLAGDVDVNVGSDSKSCALFTASDDVVIIGTVQRGDRYSTIVAPGSGYEDWADLKGKTVATRLGTGAEQVILRYFDGRDDLSWDDFEWVNVDVGDMAPLLEAGQVEAFTAWEPTPAIAEARGVGRVMMSYGDVALVPVSIHTTRQYLDENEDALVEFMGGHRRKVELIEGDPAAAAAFAALAAKNRGVDVPEEAFEAMFRRIDFSLRFDDAALAALEDTCRFLVDQGKLEAVPEIRWTSEITDEALKGD